MTYQDIKELAEDNNTCERLRNLCKQWLDMTDFSIDHNVSKRYNDLIKDIYNSIKKIVKP